MNKPTNRIVLLIQIFFITVSFGQIQLEVQESKKAAELFQSTEMLTVKVQYSNRELKKATNDSTYLPSQLVYKTEDGISDSLKVQLRRRGNNRLENCYFAPVKIKIKKDHAKKTLFKGNKNLKLVLPCLIQRDNNDNVIKEYIAYKLYEFVSPVHFKTRLVDLTYEEIKGKKIKEHQLKAFLIEDDKNVANRFEGKVYERDVHPLQQDDLTSVRHAMFQYMIGNVDFSQMKHHNVKLLFVNKLMIPVPYDFDMSGLANCSYGTTDESLNLSGVTQRKYRGFKRDPRLFEQVRQEFLSNKQQMMAVFDTCKPLFESNSEYDTAKNYIIDFFTILADMSKFQDLIVNEARTNQ